MARYSENWKELSDLIKERQGYQCQDCSHTSRGNHVHHIIPKKIGGPDAGWNLRTVCAACHGLYPGNGHEKIRNKIDYNKLKNYSPRVRPIEKQAIRNLQKIMYNPRKPKARKLELLQDLIVEMMLKNPGGGLDYYNDNAA